MEKRNVTLSLPCSLLKKAKITAVKEDKSLNQMIKESIEEKTKKDTGYKEAKFKHLKILEAGFNLGTNEKTKFSREEVHERR